jgi:copper homeostasis protein
MAMVRPRGGDFCYTDAELEVMAEDVEQLKQAGADGIVLGLLRPDGTVDAERTARLMARARPLSVTFHRAFDMSRDPREALETLIDLGVERVLTTGLEPTVLEGAGLLRQLVEAAADRITVMPGGPVSERVMRQVVERTGARELHFACFEDQPSPMRYRNPRVYMGAALYPPEYSRSLVSAERVRAMIRAGRG